LIGRYVLVGQKICVLEGKEGVGVLYAVLDDIVEET